jgi:hypothetical protein
MTEPQHHGMVNCCLDGGIPITLKQVHQLALRFGLSFNIALRYREAGMLGELLNIAQADARFNTALRRLGDKRSSPGVGRDPSEFEPAISSAEPIRIPDALMPTLCSDRMMRAAGVGGLSA